MTNKHQNVLNEVRHDLALIENTCGKLVEMGKGSEDIQKSLDRATRSIIKLDAFLADVGEGKKLYKKVYMGDLPMNYALSKLLQTATTKDN